MQKTNKWCKRRNNQMQKNKQTNAKNKQMNAKKQTNAKHQKKRWKRKSSKKVWKQQQCLFAAMSLHNMSLLQCVNVFWNGIRLRNATNSKAKTQCNNYHMSENGSFHLNYRPFTNEIHNTWVVLNTNQKGPQVWSCYLHLSVVNISTQILENFWTPQK